VANSILSKGAIAKPKRKLSFGGFPQSQKLAKGAAKSKGPGQMLKMAKLKKL
jgi:hypothetical protein